jgi:hypothetical protein
MALKHTTALVTTSVGLLVKVPTGVPSTAVQVFNGTGATIYLGDSTIASSGANQGNTLTNGSSVQIWLKANDELYAICGSSPAGYVSILYSA